MHMRYAAFSVVNRCSRRANPCSAYAPDAGIGSALHGENDDADDTDGPEVGVGVNTYEAVAAKLALAVVGAAMIW